MIFIFPSNLLVFFGTLLISFVEAGLETYIHKVEATEHQLSLGELFNRSSSFADTIINQTTLIIIGNQISTQAEVYQVTFTCHKNSSCTPLPLEDTDLVWSSPDTPGISEVKYVVYKNQPAVLCTTENGVIIYGYPSGNVLFHRNIESSFHIGIHSAEVLPDGNVVAAGSMPFGVFVILYPDGDIVVQAIADTVVLNYNVTYGHGAVYDKSRKLLYIGGYLTFLVLNYTSADDGRGSLEVVKSISLESYYDEVDKNEDEIHEDGVHDMYPIDGNFDNIFLTTGEHVFIVDVVKNYSVHKYPNLYTIPSQESENRNVSVKDKGGVKAVSMSAKTGLVIAKSVPWFKEYYEDPTDLNYSVHSPVLLWTTWSTNSITSHCSQPGYDVGDVSCRINFDDLQPIAFYKARIFNLPAFSYDLQRHEQPRNNTAITTATTTTTTTTTTV